MAERAEANANMENIDFEMRGLPLETVTSADGTTIAFEKSGEGPSVVIVGGGLNEKAMHAKLAEELSARFTVYNYDRRGRGASGDKPMETWSVDREVEDLAAVLEAAGGESASVFANCSGGMIAVRAAATGVPMAKLAMYEPPYGGPGVPDGHLEKLKALIAADRRSDAVALFLKEDALFSEEEVVRLKKHPIWPSFESMAPSTIYDSILSIEADGVPSDLLARITVPTLLMCGSESLTWMVEMCRSLANGTPKGQFVSMESAGHLMNDTLGAVVLTKFFLE